jgi:hypothetical protein
MRAAKSYRRSARRDFRRTSILNQTLIADFLGVIALFKAQSVPFSASPGELDVRLTPRDNQERLDHPLYLGWRHQRRLPDSRRFCQSICHRRFTVLASYRRTNGGLSGRMPATSCAAAAISSFNLLHVREQAARALPRQSRARCGR